MNDTQKKIIPLLESLYGTCKGKNKKFLVTNRNESEVRQEILDKCGENGIPVSNIDLYITTSQINEDVYIQV